MKTRTGRSGKPGWRIVVFVASFAAGITFGVWFMRPVVERFYLSAADWWTRRGMPPNWFLIAGALLALVVLIIVVRWAACAISANLRGRRDGDSHLPPDHFT
jgi:hypothetical protein